MNNISALEVFIKAPDIQYFKNIKIIIGLPFSEIIFEKKDFENALKTASLKSLGGFNDEKDVILYLNNEIIENNDIMFWENSNINDFIEKNKIKLKKKNIITIEFLNNCNFEYFKHLLIFDENDEKELEKELERWKTTK